jgi:hypothetical protein
MYFGSSDDKIQSGGAEISPSRCFAVLPHFLHHFCKQRIWHYCKPSKNRLENKRNPDRSLTSKKSVERKKAVEWISCDIRF